MSSKGIRARVMLRLFLLPLFVSGAARAETAEKGVAGAARAETAEQEEALDLDLSLDAITDFTTEGGSVRRFYPHEDIYVVIYLTNQGERPVPVSTPEFNWHQHLQVNLERREEQEDKPQLEEDTNTLQHLRVNLGQRENERWVSTPTRVRFIREFRQVHPRYREKLPESRPVAAGMLPPGEQIVAGVALTDENGKRPNPGIYRVTATFGSLGRFTRTIEFEVRETLTTEDRLNSLYHQGVRARWDKKYGEAERALKELIILHPTSARAHAELGAIKLDQGDYKAAVEWFRKAATLVQTAADPYIPQSQRFREDWEAALQQSIEKCQRLANPKQ